MNESNKRYFKEFFFSQVILTLSGFAKNLALLYIIYEVISIFSFLSLESLNIASLAEAARK